ncbi:MAG: T9SS type A sorting domain-containing protein [Candidatus Cloacimonetes bacterium]|nr:T9SS type A sorting domain-containing protein [Candidatus Cloacimonadota bacterium]
MKRLLFITLFLLSLLSLSAQWSDSPAAPTAIATGAGEQSLPKVAVAPNGNTYIGYFDNATGAYQLYLKLYDADGNALWQEPLAIPGNVNDTWLTDYDLITDNNGYAILGFQDIRGGFNQAFVYKISPAGTQIWGETGICLSTNASFENPDYNPVLLCSSDHRIYAAWTQMGDYTYIYVQKLNPDGTFAWAQPYLLGFYGASATWPQLIETTDNEILMKYYEDSGVPWAPTRHLYAMCISSAGEMLWNSPISTAGGISAWTQNIAFVSDTMGGAFIAWHADPDLDNISKGYFAHIDADGELSTPLNGVLISTLNQYHHFYPRLSYNTTTQEAFIAMRITDLGQNNAGVLLQRFNLTGEPLFGAEGYIQDPISQYDFEPLYAWNFLGKYYMFQSNTDLSQPNNQGICCTFNSEAGSYNTWYGTSIASWDSAKMHYSFATHPQGWVICVWEDGLSDFDIYGAKCWFNGSIGDYKGAAENAQAQFIPPYSIRLTWDPPLYSTPDFYSVQAGNYDEFIPNSESEYTFQELPAGTYLCLVHACYGNDMMTANAGTIEIPVANSDELATPLKYVIFPNPFLDACQISIKGSSSETLKLSIFNLKGQKVRDLGALNPKQGELEYLWDGKDSRGQDLAAGIYFLRSEHAGKTEFHKILKLKP